MYLGELRSLNKHNRVLSSPSDQPFDDESNIAEILKKTKGKRVIVVSDYDGVMVPTTYGDRALSRPMIDTVAKFANLPNADFKIVTGRNYAKIKRILQKKLEGHGIIGSHPLHNIDIYGSDGNELNSSALGKFRFQFKEIEDRVMNLLRDKEIAHLYDAKPKKIVLTSHLSDFIYKVYTNINSLDFQFTHISNLPINSAKKKEVEEIVRSFADEALGKDQYTAVKTKNYYRIFPRDPEILNKGDAIDNIYREASSNTVVLFFGDDHNDVPAFQKIQERGGLAIQVGRKLESKTLLELKDHESVLKLYQAIADQKMMEYLANSRAA